MGKLTATAMKASRAYYINAGAPVVRHAAAHWHSCSRRLQAISFLRAAILNASQAIDSDKARGCHGPWPASMGGEGEAVEIDHIRSVFALGNAFALRRPIFSRKLRYLTYESERFVVCLTKIGGS
jgi:hypothetical protein